MFQYFVGFEEINFYDHGSIFGAVYNDFRSRLVERSGEKSNNYYNLTS